MGQGHFSCVAWASLDEMELCRAWRSVVDVEAWSSKPRVVLLHRMFRGDDGELDMVGGPCDLVGVLDDVVSWNDTQKS